MTKLGRMIYTVSKGKKDKSKVYAHATRNITLGRTSSDHLLEDVELVQEAETLRSIIVRQVAEVSNHRQMLANMRLEY